MTATVSSALALGTLAALTLFNPARLDAAAALAQVAQANQAYRGWVHMTSESPGEKPGDAPRVGRTHLDTADGTFFSERQQGTWREIRMIIPAANEVRTYDSGANQIVIEHADLSGAVDHLRNFPLTVAAAEADRQKRGLPPARIEQHAEGNLDRFDLAVPPSAPATRPSLPLDFERATVWSDPKTKLITRIDVKYPGKPAFSVTATYGGPALTSLYDLGVPRDTKVIDKRHP